jgi:hypothetical protein
VQDRLKKLTSERDFIEKELKDKLEHKRKALYEWDKLERDVANARLKSELAEQQLGSIAF